MIKIAVDNQVPFCISELAKQHNIEIVVWAGDLHDNFWFEEALDAGAKAFVSPDYDIERLCDLNGVKYIRLPKGKGKILAQRVVQSVLRHISNPK